MLSPLVATAAAVQCAQAGSGRRIAGVTLSSLGPRTCSELDMYVYNASSQQTAGLWVPLQTKHLVV